MPTPSSDGDWHIGQVKYEAELSELRTAVEGVLHELVVGKLTSAATRQASVAISLQALHDILGHVTAAHTAQGFEWV